MSNLGEELYTSGISQALVVRQQEMDNDRRHWEIERRNEQGRLDAAKAQLVQQAMKLQGLQVQNQVEQSRLSAANADVQHERSLVLSQKNAVASREVALREAEERIRRNRTRSEVYIEDVYPGVGAHEAVKNLTHTSLRVRMHARCNVSFCLSGSSEPGPTFISLRPQLIAPLILPQLHAIASSISVTQPDLAFCQSVVSSTLLVEGLAQCGEYRRLGQWLLEKDANINGLAIRALRLMISLDASTAKSAYTTLASAVPLLPDRDSTNDKYHPAVDFLVETAARLVKDCFANNLHSAISPLITHQVARIRVAVLPLITSEAQASLQTRIALVKAGTHKLLNHLYVPVAPPSDVIAFFVTFVPLIVGHLCEEETNILWLLKRLTDTNSLIGETAAQALRDGAISGNHHILKAFVEVDILRRLSQPPTPQTLTVTQLVLDLMPILALQYTRKRLLSSIIAFIDHSNPGLSSACVVVCIGIAKSTVENRAQLHAATKQLDHSNESLLALLDHALPLFCKDWAAADKPAQISHYLFHSQKRLRLAAGGVWLELISTSPAFRSQLVSQNLLGVIFQLSQSADLDCAILGRKVLPFIALNILEAGSGPIGQLLDLLQSPASGTRHSALETIRIIVEGGSKGRQALHEAGVYTLLLSSLESDRFNDFDAVRRTLIPLTRLEASSPKACATLLLFLDSKHSKMADIAQRALASIEMQPPASRQVLLKCVMDRLVGSSETLLDYASKAIRDWVASDLIEFGNLKALYTLLSNSSSRIEEAALAHLRRMVLDPASLQLLLDSDFLPLLDSLTSSASQDCLDFLASCLTTLAEAIVFRGSLELLIRCVSHTEHKIRESASQAILKVSTAGDQVKQVLIQYEVLELFLGDDDDVELKTIRLSLVASLIPNLALDYLKLNKLDLFLGLIDHQNELVQRAATTSLSSALRTSVEQRQFIHSAVLQRLEFASPAFCEVAAVWISDSIASDLFVGHKYGEMFRLVAHHNPNVRTSALEQLRHYIHTANEGIRLQLLEADLIPSVLQLTVNGGSDYLAFLVEIMPVLGPALIKRDGGAFLLSFLHRQDMRLRAASIASIKNGLNSHHGPKYSAKAALISALYLLMQEGADVLELWCHILPILTPYFCHQQDVETLFNALNYPHADVTTASMKSITTLSKLTEKERLLLFPVLLHHLDQDVIPSPDCLAEALKCSGSIFVSHGQISNLLQLVQLKGDAHRPIALAAVDTVIGVLERRRPSDAQMFMEANIFGIVLAMRSTPQQALGNLLFRRILPYLSRLVFLEKQNTQTLALFDLLNDNDDEISGAILATLSGLGSGLYESPHLIEIIEKLSKAQSNQNEAVRKFLCEFASRMTGRLLDEEKAFIVMSLLRSPHTEVMQSYLQGVVTWARSTSPDRLTYLMNEPSFVTVVGGFLKGNDGNLRRLSSELIDLLCQNSAPRSRQMVRAGIPNLLAYLAERGTETAQPASLEALLTLLKATPDDTEQLVQSSLPVLRTILEDDQRKEEVHTNTLNLLLAISQMYTHSAIVGSGIIPSIVLRLRPRNVTQRLPYEQQVYDIAYGLASKSDEGRKALMTNDQFLFNLHQMLQHRSAVTVLYGCRILSAIAASEAFCQELATASLRFGDEMRRIVSPFRPSTIKGGNSKDKMNAQSEAKLVLESFKALKSKMKVPKQPPVGTSVISGTRHFRSISDSGPVYHPPVQEQHISAPPSVVNSSADYYREALVSAHKHHATEIDDRTEVTSFLPTIHENGSAEHIQPINATTIHRSLSLGGKTLGGGAAPSYHTTM